MECLSKILVEQCPVGFGLQKVIRQNGEPVDFCFLEINPSFAQLLGVNKEHIIGNRMSQFPLMRNWVKEFCIVASMEGNKEFLHYMKFLNKWYKISVFSTHHDFLGVYINNPTRELSAIIELENCTNVNDGSLIDLDEAISHIYMEYGTTLVQVN